MKERMAPDHFQLKEEKNIINKKRLGRLGPVSSSETKSYLLQYCLKIKL